MATVKVYRALRGTHKVETVDVCMSVEEADEQVRANHDPHGCWLYFREPVEGELEE